ncbi:ABC transporter permease [Paenibacillaceae bacterium]|nr:ABC transporter permease [Paenibacillaceae bacterium]
MSGNRLESETFLWKRHSTILWQKGITMNGRSIKALWSERSRAFRKESLPYFQYMIMSGLPGFLILLLILGSIGYGTLFRNVQPDFPIVAIGAIVLTPFLSWSPLRTWLQQPDIVFLMPREQEMGGYISKSWRYNGIGGFIGAALIIALYWPLYDKVIGESALSLALLIPIAAVIKGVNMIGSWKERRMAWPGARQASRLLRWVGTALLIAVFLTAALWKSLLFMLLIIAAGWAALRLPQMHYFPWERLITEEERTRKRYYTLFSAFIDVPLSPSRITRRRYLSWIANRVPYLNENTYKYLYTNSLLRTELGGMLVRMTVVGAVFILVTGEARWLSGWMAAGMYLLFLLVIGVQTVALRSVHKHTVWRHIYPLPSARRDHSLNGIIITATAICGALMWLVLALLLIPAGLWQPTVGGLAVGLIYVLWLLPARLRRKKSDDFDE